MKRLMNTITDKKEASNLVDDELKESNILLGKTDVYGEGVVVNLADGEIAIEAYDLIDLVNELRYAGAEAISINDIRILPMTDIVDLGDYTYISINSQRTQGPYVVKAIGNKEQLSSALNMKGSGFIDRITSNKKVASTEMENKIEIPKYNQELEIKYMQSVETK